MADCCVHPPIKNGIFPQCLIILMESRFNPLIVCFKLFVDVSIFVCEKYGKKIYPQHAYRRHHIYYRRQYEVKQRQHEFERQNYVVDRRQMKSIGIIKNIDSFLWKI